MLRNLLFAAALIALLSLVGCGGNASNTDQITIRSNGFFPNQKSVPVNTKINFFNSDNGSHSVISGTLASANFPQTFQSQLLDNGFDILDIVVTQGDSIVFTNTTTLQAQFEVKDQNNADVFSSAVLPQNGSATWVTTSAGFFTVRNSLNPINIANITVVGIPVPDGLFNSGNLASGQIFSFTPTTAGTINYFDGVSRAAQGTITVTP